MKISVIVPVYNNEKFVLDALQSVDEQGISDLELIVVNDGSSDGSEEVIREFAGTHPYVVFISQENKGVSAARNAALDVAQGEYVGFLDSDDVYRPSALENMLYVAEENKADLVIGESKSVGTFGNSPLPQASRLSKKTFISKDDPDLVYNFSVCNKLFRRDLIEKNNLRFQAVKHAEDGLFLFSYINCCGVITGCPRYVYEYRKRIVLDSQSALKSLNETMLDSALEATDRIGEIVKKTSESLYEEYNRRVMRVTLLNEYYRRLWTLDDKAVTKLIANLEKYKARLDEESWNRVLELTQDIDITEGFRTKEQIAADPAISVIVPAGLDADDYSNLLQTVYFQLCPDFEVIADSSYKDITGPEYSDKLNFRFCADEDGSWRSLIEASKGEMITIAASPCIYNENTLQVARRYLKKSGTDFISFMIRGYDDGQAYVIREIEDVFKADKIIDNNTRSHLNETDGFWINKLFYRRAVLKLFDWCRENEPDKAPAEYAKDAFRVLLYDRAKSIICGAPVKCFASLKSDITLLERDAAVRGPKKMTHWEIFLWAVYHFCRIFIPVRKNRVLFLSDIRGRIGGNYKPLYNELEKKGFDIICDFKASKSVKESRRRQVIRMYNVAVSRYIVLEDFHQYTERMRVRRNQDLVQLWHAAGAFKKFAWSRALSSEKLNVNAGYKKITKAIVSAEAIRCNYAEAYQIDISKVLPTGIPRTDIFYDRSYMENIRAEYDKRYPALAGKKILLICPTYRGRVLSNATYAFDQLDPGRILEVLGDEYVVVFKWHPALTTVLRKKRIEPYDYAMYNGRVMDMSDEPDINNLLMISDACITDYSSVIFEYELMDKPMIYYWYDANDYRMGRGVYYDLDEYVYGRVAYNFEELLEALRDMDLSEDKRAAFHEKFMSACDGHAAKRVADVIFTK